MPKWGQAKWGQAKWGQAKWGQATLTDSHTSNKQILTSSSLENPSQRVVLHFEASPFVYLLRCLYL